MLYDARLATDRMSTELEGVFAPPEALRILLGGTGLVGRFASETAVVVVPSSPAAVRQVAPIADAKKDGSRSCVPGITPWCRIGSAMPSASTMCCDRAVTGSPCGSGVAPTGAVQQTQLLSKTGDGRVDGAIETTLRGQRIGKCLRRASRSPLRWSFCHARRTDARLRGHRHGPLQRRGELDHPMGAQHRSTAWINGPLRAAQPPGRRLLPHEQRYSDNAPQPPG